MNDTLWGVAIGGAVAIVSALITSVVGPAMTARHQRANSRAERLLVAVADFDDAVDGWGASRASSETETAVIRAMRRLATATNSTLLQLAIDEAFEGVTNVRSVPGPDGPWSPTWNKAMSDAMDSIDEVARIAADMVDPPILPIRVARWVSRRQRLRRLWLERRRIALAGGA